MSAPPATHQHPITGSTGSTGSTGNGPVRVADAIEAFLTAPRLAGSPHTRRAYRDVLHRVADRLGPNRELADIDDNEIEVALTALWSSAAPSTWNRNRAAVSSWLSWCTTKARWAAPGMPGTCERRTEPTDHTKAVDRASIDAICTRRDIKLRERVLWRMLYETVSRASAVLALNVEDCDLDNRRARVQVKGGHTEWIVWGRGTALLLPRYLTGRTRGPLFRTDRRPGPARRATTATRDLCPDTGRARLGYDRARVLIAQHTGLSL
ncbi:MAG: site-specific integrase, partial [Pseudonocardiales bacterium]